MEAGIAFLVASALTLAVLRAKLTTFEYQGREIPFGPELLYEQAKGYAFKRMPVKRTRKSPSRIT